MTTNKSKGQKHATSKYKLFLSFPNPTPSSTSLANPHLRHGARDGNFSPPWPNTLCPARVSPAPQRYWGEMGQDIFPASQGGARMGLGLLASPNSINIKDLICITKYLNAWILDFLFYCDIILWNTLDNIIQSLLKISLISCNKFNCNFKFIYINETCLKKIVIDMQCWERKSKNKKKKSML